MACPYAARKRAAQSDMNEVLELRIYAIQRQTDSRFICISIFIIVCPNQLATTTGALDVENAMGQRIGCRALLNELSIPNARGTRVGDFALCQHRSASPRTRAGADGRAGVR